MIKRPGLQLWILLLMVFNFNPLYATGTETISEAWQYFYINDISNARDWFERAAMEDESAAEAHLMLSILASMDRTDAESFRHFIKFFQMAPDPLPPAFALWNTGSLMGGNGKKSAEQLKLLKEIIKAGQTDGTLKAMSYQMLGYHYESIGEEDKAKSFFDQTGSITEWQMTGEFDNISASGFHKPFQPESHPEEDFVFKGKNNADVQWFDLKGTRIDRWIDFTYHFYTDDAIIYAQNFCKSPVEQEVQFRIGTSGSLKFMVNDHLIFSEQEERNNDLDTYVCTAKLKKGWNRILIKIGSSEINRSNFMLRITNTKGDNLQELEFSSQPKPYDQNYSFESKTVENFAEDFFQEEIIAHPKKMINYILLAETYMRNDKTYEARKVIKDAQKLAPECSYLRWQLIQVYLRDQNRTDLSKELERLKEDDPENPLAMELFYDEAIGKEDYTGALVIVEKMQKIYGEDENVLGKKISLASFNGEMEKLIDLISKAYNMFPEDYTFVLLKYSLENDIRKDKNAAIKVIKNYLKNNYSDDAINILANAYLDDGEISKGIATMKKLIEHNPVAVGYYSSIANLYYQTGDYENAEVFYKKCLEIAPYIDAYHSGLGAVYGEMGKKAEAIKSFEKSIELNPNDYETRKQLRKLQEKKDVFEYFVTPDMDNLFKNSPDGEKFPEDNSLILLDESQNVVYESGGSEERHFLLVKVFNPSGIDTWKEYFIPYFNNQSLLIEKAEVIKQNGNKIAAETNDNQIIFTALEAGDAIHLVYRIENYYFGKLTTHFWDKHFFNLFFPSKHSRYSLLIAKNKTFDYKVLRSDIKPSIIDHDEFTHYIWESNNLPAVKYETYMPRLTDVGQVLHISTFPDWDFISKWYSDISKEKASSDFEITAVTREIFSEKKYYSEREKLERIYDYVVTNIRYSSVPFLQSGIVPQKATKVINTKIGDCKDVSTLFVSLCSEVGINARLMLINTRDNGLDDMPLPSIAFNHCIATVNLEGKDYLVELTSDNLPFGAGHTSVHRSFGLTISDDPSEKISAAVMDPPTRVKNEMIRKSIITFEGDKMSIHRSNIRTGILASTIRAKYRDIGKETQEKELLESISSKYTDLKLDTLIFDENLKSTADSVRYEYQFTVNKIYTEIAGLSIFDIPFADAAQPADFTSSGERSYPIEYWKYAVTENEIETIEIEIPEGKTLSEIPSSVSYKCPFAEYRQTYLLERNKLLITRELHILDDFIPAENFEEFRAFYLNIVKADEQKLAWK